MATIFRRSKKKHSPYTIQYSDHQGKRQTVVGFTDKGLTEQLAARLETEARLRRTGLIDVDQEKLVETKHAPIDPLLDAFESSLGDNSEKHVKLTLTRIRRIIGGCKIEKLAEIGPERIQSFLREERKTKGIGHRTYNHYLQAFDSFCNWCVATKRLLMNPIAGLERLNVEVDVRHKRRALAPDEIGALVNSARESVELVQCFDGEQRARIYLIAYMTGLRRNEIASLTPRSFALDADPPTVTIEAKDSKHKKRDVLPLHPDLVAMVRGWMKGMKPGDALFPKLAGRRTWLMVKKDLERVGIAYENEDGIADFHAAGRHTHITELLRNGVSLPEAQKLARHSDIKMTMKYAHIGIADQAKAVANLPSPALHWRCISGVTEGHSVAAGGTQPRKRKRRNPVGDSGFGVDCHSVTNPDKLEAAGIEPASCDPSTVASTCVFD